MSGKTVKKIKLKPSPYTHIPTISFVIMFGAAIYYAMLQPMIDPTEYQAIQASTRKDIKQEDIQPGNMRVWSDPFAPLPEKK